MLEKVSTIYENGQLLKASEVARILNISRSLVYNLIQTGKIPHIRISQSVRVRQDDLNKFIEGNRTDENIYSIYS
ncbi:MAG: helix-turn-helix domain-containing protein [Pelolinea sp.]|nr:helix-turn-helix domain-containing protein [Pelolinea sp.]